MINIEALTNVPGVRVRDGGRDGWHSFDCPSDSFLDLVKLLTSEFYFDSLADLAAIDMGEGASKRFGCVYHLFSHQRKKFLRIVVMCDENAYPALPSLTSIFGNANWHEREAFDMMGIVFHGHPDLRRIMMWDSYPWFPLRKDFPLEGRDAPPPPEYDSEPLMKVVPVPMEGGPFSSKPGSADTSGKEPRSRAEI